MMEVYKGTYDEFMPTHEVTDASNMETDVDEAEGKEYAVDKDVIEIAKEKFHERLTNIMTIVYGLASIDQN